MEKIITQNYKGGLAKSITEFDTSKGLGIPIMQVGVTLQIGKA